MRTLRGLLTVLLIFGLVGMGLFTVDAPALEERSSVDEVVEDIPEARSTRRAPDPEFDFINLYFHTIGNCMNTSIQYVNPYPYSTTTFSFTLQSHTETDALIHDYWVKHPEGGVGMQAQIYIDTPTDLEINVYDQLGDQQTRVGHAEFTEISQQVRHYEAIDIPFDASWGGNYTFKKGHEIVIQFSFTGGGLHYDRPLTLSCLTLYSKPITDISISTYNFNDEPTKLFYPNDIDEPVERKKVKVKGEWEQALGDHWMKYIRNVKVEIQKGDDVLDTVDANFNRKTYTYSATWTYDAGIDSGEYNVTTIIRDEQNNTFSVTNTFNITRYGVLLTSPSQVGGEGSYTDELAKAKRNVIQYGETSYLINVRNIGNYASGVEFFTSGPTSGWGWWLEGDNLTEENLQTGEISEIAPGDVKGVYLTIDSEDNKLKAKASISITGASIMNAQRDSTLTTITTVVTKYHVEMRFITGDQDSQTQEAEIGDEVSYDFLVTNAGGSDDVFWFTYDTLPSQWSVTMTGEKLGTNDPTYGDYYVELGSAEPAEITFTLHTAGTGGDLEVTIGIKGWSWGSKEQNDPEVVSDRIETTTILTTGIELEVVNDPEKTGKPDDLVNFEFKLTNTGSNPANYIVTFSPPSSSDGWETEDVSFESNSYDDEKEYNLSGGDSSSFFLWVKPTSEVLAKNYSLPVRAEREDDSERYVDKTVYIIVEEFFSIEVIEPLSLDLEGKADPGDDVEYYISIENRGNAEERVTILVDKPSGWTVDFGNASSEWSEVLQPGDREDITIVLGVPDDVEGDETVDITISVVPAESETIDIETHTKIESRWYQPLIMLLVPILLFIVIIVMVIVIFKRR
ncbi:MAG: hypothetical protein JSW28_00795 [Thermoplasmata archaeon]|nr:MAG: hypothetical protein JSW28_00795 [Thermoplasmata archaeon]